MIRIIQNYCNQAHIMQNGNAVFVVAYTMNQYIHLYQNISTEKMTAHIAMYEDR